MADEKNQKWYGIPIPYHFSPENPDVILATHGSTRPRVGHAPPRETLYCTAPPAPPDRTHSLIHNPATRHFNPHTVCAQTEERKRDRSEPRAPDARRRMVACLSQRMATESPLRQYTLFSLVRRASGEVRHTRAYLRAGGQERRGQGEESREQSRAERRAHQISEDRHVH